MYLYWVKIVSAGGVVAAKVTHIFLRNPRIVERLQQQAGREYRSKTAVVIRALERYFAEADVSEERSQGPEIHRKAP